MSAPTFVFDHAGNKTSWNPDRGLEDFGPFDSEVFTPKRPKLSVVTPREFQGDVEVFLRKFKDGVPNASTFAQGFVRKYRLSDCSFEVHSFDTSSDPAASYRNACLGALQGEIPPVLAIVIIREDYKALQ